MELFNGGVKEAIAEAKAKKTVFVVIVTGLKNSSTLLDKGI